MLLPTRLETMALQKGHPRVRFHRSGSGPAMVLLHGYPDNLQVWNAVVPLLTHEHDVIAVDWPGMGDSDPWPGGATPFNMADRLIALFDHWRIDRATVVGLDMGGQPVLVAAARHPERIRSAVVTGSLVQWDERTSWEITLLRRFGFNQLVLGRMPRLVFARAWRTFLPAGMKLGAVRDEFWRCFRRPEVRDFIIRMCAGYQGTLPLLPLEYERITVPLLVLWGARDQHFPVEHAERLHRQVPHSLLEIVAGGEHWLPLHEPQQFAHAVSTFCRHSSS